MKTQTRITMGDIGAASVLNGGRMLGTLLVLALLTVAAPALAQTPLSVKAIAAGCAHSVALASDGTVWQWGNNLPDSWCG